MILLRKYAPWLILAMMAGIAGVWLLYSSNPVSYLSTAQVDVEPHLVSFATPIQPNMGTEAVVATSGVVLANTARILNTTTGSIANSLTSSVARTTGSTATGSANVLTIGCAMPTAAAAQRCAAAATTAYMAFRNDTALSRFARAHDPLQVTLITSATWPADPAGSGKKILLPIGALLGLALGVGGIFIRDHFDNRVRDPADLERSLGAPVVAVIPRVKHDSAHPAGVTGSRDPRSPSAEAYRYLREHLDSLMRDTPTRGSMLLVASPHPGDGRTCVAANLATVLAEAGAKVMLVDADIRHPSLNEVFETDPGPGLAEMLAGRASLEDVAVNVFDGLGLMLVTAGHVGNWPAQAFQVAWLNQVFGKIRDQADIVVVDSAPVLEASQTLALARMSDVVMVVADVRRTERNAVAATAEQLRAAGSPILIGVLNGVPLSKKGQMWPGAARTWEPDSIVRSPTVREIMTTSAAPPGSNGQGPPVHAQPGTGPDRDGNHQGPRGERSPSYRRDTDERWPPF